MNSNNSNNSNNNIDKRSKYLTIPLIILIILLFGGLIVLTLLYKPNKKCDNKFTEKKNIHYSQNNGQYQINKTIVDILNEYNITKDEKNFDIYFPQLYDDIDEELDKAVVIENARYFFIDNCDRMAAKESLWRIVASRYPDKDELLKLIPNTYILYDKDDRDRLFKDFNKDKLYILKKNIQRQDGILIVDDISKILRVDNTYVVAQELLQDPYLINKRKINLRVYVLIICNKKNINVSMYDDGFMYYTADYFEPNTTDIKKNVTTGYIDRTVYDVNPLTHQDFKIYLNSTNRELTQNEIDLRMKGYSLSEYTFNNIQSMLKKIFICFVNQIYLNPKMQNNMCFQLFGVDVAINDKLDATIMEINKGPDLSAKDQRDSDLKHDLVRNIFNKVNILDIKCQNNFIELINYNRKL